MKLPHDTLIAREKITEYLLKEREDDDKSKFLGRAGYSLISPDQFEKDLRQQILVLEADLSEKDEYGDKYQIRGELKGPNNIALKVVTIWMHENAVDVWKFITLFPDKKEGE
jgi:hypothetical protein